MKTRSGVSDEMGNQGKKWSLSIFERTFPNSFSVCAFFLHLCVSDSAVW